MKKNLIYFLLGCSMLSYSSCKKDKDIAPVSDSGSKDHYMPLSVGNSWTYNSDYYGEYTVSITGTKEINNKEYYTLANSLPAQPASYMRYTGNKLYQYSTINNSSLELLVVDEDAAEGQEWVAGNVSQSVPSMYSYSIRYTCKLVQFHETYKLNEKTYANVKEINLKTTIEDFKFGSYYTSLLSAEQLALMKTELESTLLTSAINQTQFFAKGIGYVNQVSETMSKLNVELISFIIK